jgi:hypothetical protein
MPWAKTASTHAKKPQPDRWKIKVLIINKQSKVFEKNPIVFIRNRQ